MSRFGLRSCSDGLKISEEKHSRRKASNPTSISSKRTVNPKELKFSAHLNNNDENLIDDIKIETDEIEKSTTDTCDKFIKNNKTTAAAAAAAENDEDEEEPEHEHDYDNKDEHDGEQLSPICKGTLVCSLPLERINEIIKKLKLNKSKVELEKEPEEIMIDETMDNDDDEEDDANISKQSASNIKNLCLYCDRKFSSHKMQLKHVDKFHCLQQDRRCSGRNAQLQQQAQNVQRKRKSALTSQNFPGCNFCHKTKGQTQQPVILPAAELSSLFLHLTDCHTDKYFGCKTCVIRFQNISKLAKHMEVVHKSLPFAFDETSSKSKDNDTDSLVSVDKLNASSSAERSKMSLKRQQRSQKSLSSSINMMGTSVAAAVSLAPQCSTAITPNTSVIGAEEPILSRLGLTQNRLPNNRKGVRLRREKLLPEMLLKSEQNHHHTSSTNFAFGPTTSLAASTSSSTNTTCSPKLRGKSLKSIGGFSGDTTSDVVFRVPTRNDILSCVFDDNFYKEVVSNVRNNLHFHLDGKVRGNSLQELDATLLRHAHQPQIRSTLVKSPIVVTTVDSEIHAATSLAAITAFPTLLTAEQFGGDTGTSKIRRPHTKNSWKWKWDSVKKFKLINEGGKIIKKMKHPMLGLRDLSKLDMWTQLTMRQKHELQQQQKVNLSANDYDWDQQATSTTTSAEISTDPSREEKQRVNDQLNFILDMRLLPHIILEQNEQAIIKLENDEFGITPTKVANEDCGESFMAQTFADEGFLSMLNLLPNCETQNTRTKLVLSGEWARPRCYLCICCGCKFEKLKSLEEHKMFRHSQILSTHYEVVGRELLNGNLLRHLFLPKKALSRYGNESDKLIYTGAARRLFWHKNETIIREITNNEESSDSLQSMLHSCVTNSPSVKNSSSSTEDCDLDSKLSASAALQLIGNSAVVSPTHSIQSCSSSSSAGGMKNPLKMSSSLRTTPVTTASCSAGYGCSKCGRKSNGVLDLYRHMLDCSGDYIWSLAKKRKYRYYCGSKKRRPCNKHSILELRKNKNKTAVKSLSISNDNTNEEGAISSSNFTKLKTSPRSRPSDAESIKKMLENLPAKRVCKKIFPTLNKTKKKSVKSIKPKLLAKHKIYNSLRKTRVRQLAQVAKMLSKSKSQLKGSKKMVTRSAVTTISSKANRNRTNSTKRNIKMAMTKNSGEQKTSANPGNNQENVKSNIKLDKVRDEVDCCSSSSIKTEKEITKETLIEDQTKATDKTVESDKSVQIEQKSDDMFEPIKNTKDNLDKIATTEGEQLTCITSKQTLDVVTLNPEISLIETDITTKIPDDKVIVNRTAVSVNMAPVTADGERNAQTNIKGVKRSKRISDCIAMLTGKLEEKLKTEQKTKVPPAVPQVTTVTAPAIKALSPPSPAHQLFPTAAQQTSLQQMPIDLPTPTPIIEPEKCSPKKPPKRKAVSRKIIKTDIIESSAPSVAIKNLEVTAALASPKIIRPVEIMPPPPKELFPPPKEHFPPPKELLPAKATRTLTPEIAATKIAPKNISDRLFSPGDNKRPLSFMTNTVVAAMPPPPVVSATPSTLMPKMPLFIPLENVRPAAMAAPHLATMALPMPLPVPVPVPIPIENISQTSPGATSATVPPAGPNMLPTPVMPILTAVPAHLVVPPALQLTASSFNAANAVAEPLNLSNSAKNVTKHSQDLTCAGGVQRMSGMPARRQTICGFEVRNFAVFDEIEPLDLSKKSRPEKQAAANHTAAFPARHIELAPLLLPAAAQPLSVVGITNEPAMLTVHPLTPEALINKPFYSNLDLLRIPQVRNPVGGQPAAGITTLEPVQTVLAVNTSPVIVTAPAKTSNKKRSKTSIITQMPVNTNSAASSNVNETSNTTTNAKMNNAKDVVNTNSKKETAAKNKPVLRMDEEVINHIDDAINSVINAVKASLDSEEALKAQELLALKNPTPPPQPLIHVRTTDDVGANKDSGQEFKYLAAARRNMRSKTMDCRPAALSKISTKTLPNNNINQLPDYPVNVDASSTTSTTSPTVAATTNIQHGKSKPNKNAEIIKCLDNKLPTTEHLTIQQTLAEEEVKQDTKNNDGQLKLMELHSKPACEMPLNEIFIQKSKQQDEATTNGQQFSATIVNSSKQSSPQIPNFSAERTEPSSLVNVAVAVTVNEDTEAKNISATVTTKPNNLLDLEQMSNNNNTSSGFHSSAQSDQQTSVMSNSTSALSVTATESGTADTKKKQRRRRKNELAAIVADQLLESFKLDKARRDNLKKLENLAYEKSEDLLLTGMLLMSSTKRNVNSGSSSNLNAQPEHTESPGGVKRSNKSQRNPPTNENQKQNDGANTAAETKTHSVAVNEKSLESEKDPLDVTDAVSDAKKNNNKRRQYRRRGKTLDNENISKLKSSLESFSIDIERQLTEYEAKNVNVFKNVPPNENAKQTGNTKNQTCANASKSSIVLRPSLLSSVALEVSNNQDMPQAISKALANDSSKTTIVSSSRDPRLNKNIHKEDEKPPESLLPADATKEAVLVQKNGAGPEEIGDLEEDNYLTEIAKNVNEKIMSTENEEFAFKNDGFELVNDMGMDDSNSKFSRPPTSMSVRSAPNFNDDRSNFGSICDENTNTEVMDMDLDDEMSVYTSYSQDLGRGRGRRRRRRRSILLTRKPKKRASSRDLSAEKIECILCKKVFYSANSLSKHNMTLAHVSKVSEQEYLLSKSHTNLSNLPTANDLQTYGTLGPYARRSTRRNTISEPPMQSRCETNSPPLLSAMHSSVLQSIASVQVTQLLHTHAATPDAPITAIEDLKANETLDTVKPNKALQKPSNTKEQIADQEYDVNISATNAYNGNSRLNLNPDERLFFECCNILKSAETPRLNNNANATNSVEECNINTNFSYSYNQDKLTISSSVNANRPPALTNLSLEPATAMRTSSGVNATHSQLNLPHLTNSNNIHAINQQSPTVQPQQTLFRDPQHVTQSNCYNKVPVHDNRNARSPTYSAISHLSAVTNTTSRFKTKAAMKGYENVNIDLNHHQESKSRTICKLTELAEIALGNEEKPNSREFSPNQSSLTPPQVSSHANQTPKGNIIENVMRPKGLETPECVTTLLNENIRNCNVQLPTRSERTKNNETRSSTSSKTIMHSSIIKAAVEEHQKAPPSNKIVIPERPFKNIGLEEKETITFQKPKTPAVNLLTDDNNSVSTGSFSDRDDYDFGSLSCDDEVSVRESNDKNHKNNTTESSSESSRATAKTFENKSLIMGRIFKNASTKATIKTSTLNTVKVKSVGVQKDQTPMPKADLNQLFDELRGNSGVDNEANDRICNSTVNDNGAVAANSKANHKQYTQQRDNVKSFIPAASPPAVVSSTTVTLPTKERKPKARVSRAKSNAEAKSRKDISKLQSELGMSPDEIKKLIDEGQRKSKRRCATNRPKKLIEMWSSDEYEEFLSTKDIIALIEEKEQQEEKRKKRKNSLNASSTTTEVAKEKEIMADVTSSTKEPKRRNTRRMSLAADHPANLLERGEELMPPKTTTTKARKTNTKRDEPVSTTANITNASELSASKKLDKPTTTEKGRGRKAAKTNELTENSSTLTTIETNSAVSAAKRRNSNKNSRNKSKKQKTTQKAKKASPAARESSRTKYSRRQYEDAASSEEDSLNDDTGNDEVEEDDDDDDDDFLISELKNKQSRARAAAKAKSKKSLATNSAAIVTSTANATKTSKQSAAPRETPTKKRAGANNNNTKCNNSNVTNAATTASNTKNQQHQITNQTLSSTPAKTKRKNLSNQSPPRRKRLATEKLYYWSSSSDEEFGLIDNNKSNHLPPPQPPPPAANFDNNGEQYQKHGWIVGDSHKKLVTLLAIAKGNKKIDSSSGVKKNIAKKRN